MPEALPTAESIKRLESQAKSKAKKRLKKKNP